MRRHAGIWSLVTNRPRAGGTLPSLHAGRQLRIDPYDFRRWLKGGTE
jgi:hypothetical protein